MMRRSPGANKHECDEQPSPATNYQRKENCQNGAAGVGFMGTRQPDAVAHECPNAGNQSATERYHLQRTSGALRKSDHPKSGLKRLLGTANDHQTEMHDPTADKKPDHDEQMQQSLRTLGTARAAAKWPYPRASRCRLAQSGQRSALRGLPDRRKHPASLCPD